MSESRPEVPVTVTSPASLLEQMQALLDSISTNLAGIEADLQSSAHRDEAPTGGPTLG